MCNKIADIMTCTPCCTLWALRMHTRGRGQVPPPPPPPPRLTRGGGGGGADWGPRMNMWRLFSRDELNCWSYEKRLPSRRMIALSTTVSKGSATAATGELREGLYYWKLIARSGRPSPALVSLSYKNNYTNSTNLGAVVSHT